MKYQENVLENFIKSAMGNLKLKEFHITSNGEPIYHLVYKATNEIAGCFGCFFCKRRDGNYIQTCGPYKLGSCGSIFKKNHTIFKLIKRECNETNRDDMGYVQGIP